MTHPWSSLAGTLLVRAFTDANCLHIPAEVMAGSALRCAAEVVAMLGVTEVQFLDSARQAFSLAVEAQKGKVNRG